MSESAESPFELTANRYGKARVRLLKVLRGATQNTVQEWTVQVLLRGDFEAAHTLGDNSRIVATDTMKNTVYWLARRSSATEMESFAAELADHMLTSHAAVAGVEVRIAATAWDPLLAQEGHGGGAFIEGSRETQVTTVSSDRGATLKVVSGFSGLSLLKTARSAFSGFDRDALTTLPESRDRVFGTAVEANWTYSLSPPDFSAARTAARGAMLRVFTEHESESVQHTLYAMAEAALTAVPSIAEIELAMPNKHYLLVDLARFGEDNPNQIFVPTDEPHGYIEARVRRR